jgi:hypothetical protein
LLVLFIKAGDGGGSGLGWWRMVSVEAPTGAACWLWLGKRRLGECQCSFFFFPSGEHLVLVWLLFSFW